MKKIWGFILIMLIIPITLVAASTLNYVELETHTDTIDNAYHSKKIINITNDSNNTTRQEINVFTYKEGIEVVNWSKLNNNRVVLSNVLDIAKDFELNNPSYEVVGGVNGDYFSTAGTINSNVIFGNRVINPYNHQKYPSVEFNNKGLFVQLHDNNTIDLNRYYTLFNNEANKLLNYGEISINKIILDRNETSLLLNNNNHLKDDSNTYFEIEIINQISNGQHLFFEALIGVETNEITNKITLVTNDKLLLENLKTGNKIIIQNEIENFEYNHMMIGVDGMIIENNSVKKFNEMKGQSESNNTARHPRTGIGFDNNGQMILFTVDGRNPGVSNGVNLREFAEIMRNNNVEIGFNIDGGGSTQSIFKINNELSFVNNPVKESNGSIRGVANAVLMVRKKVGLPNFNVIENDKKLIINFDNNFDNINVVEININGKTERIPFNKMIEINKPELFYFGLNISVEKEGKLQTIFNNTYYQELEIENAKVEITHTYINKKLVINMSHNDVHGTINRIEILLREPLINENAKVTDDYNFSFEMDDFELNEELKFNIRIRYNDGTYKDLSYTVDNEDKLPDTETSEPTNNEETNNTFWIWVTIIVTSLLIIAILIYFFVFSKRTI